MKKLEFLSPKNNPELEIDTFKVLVGIPNKSKNMAVFGRQKIDPKDHQFYIMPSKEDLNGRVEVTQQVDQSVNSLQEQSVPPKQDSYRYAQNCKHEFLDYNNLKIEGSNKKFKQVSSTISTKLIEITTYPHPTNLPSPQIHKLQIKNPRSSSRNLIGDQDSDLMKRPNLDGSPVDPNLRNSYLKGTIYSNQSYK